MNVLWGAALTLAVVAVLGAWFFLCGRANERRQARPFAKTTLVYAGAGFVVGVAFLTSDLGSPAIEGRLAFVALTACSFLLIYAALSALVACEDGALVIVNLTGRALLLSDPELAPFYTLPAPSDQPARELPPVRPRTCYIVSAELGRVGWEAGRADLFTIDRATATDLGNARPLLVRRLHRAGSAV